jgi:hypothetical protein
MAEVGTPCTRETVLARRGVNRVPRRLDLLEDAPAPVARKPLPLAAS